MHAEPSFTVRRTHLRDFWPAHVVLALCFVGATAFAVGAAQPPADLLGAALWGASPGLYKALLYLAAGLFGFRAGFLVLCIGYRAVRGRELFATAAPSAPR